MDFLNRLNAPPIAPSIDSGTAFINLVQISATVRFNVDPIDPVAVGDHA